MDFQGSAGFLSSAPPKLEDAGLEDCALPLEGIQNMIQEYTDFVTRICEQLRINEDEAFRIAADKAMEVADSLTVNMKSKAEDIGGCVSNPMPVDGDLKDNSIETIATKPGESCVAPHTGGLLEEGKDSVVDPIAETREDKLIGGIVDDTSKLGEEGCLKGDPLEPVGIAAEASADGDDDDDEPKGPTLTEAFL